MGGDVPEDDDIDALFGLSSPSANADAVREAMEATAMAEGAMEPEGLKRLLKVDTPGTPLGSLDESFSDIFGDSPTSNINSDIVAAFQSANADIDALLVQQKDAAEQSSHTPSRVSLDEDEDEDITEFMAPATTCHHLLR